jgi:1-deoxy-D-xylulose-5-phosphate synthase
LAGEAQLLVTVEEGSLPGGFGAGVEEYLGTLPGGSRCPVLRLGLPDRFVTHGSRDKLLEEVGLVPEAVAKAVAARFGARQRAASTA